MNILLTMNARRSVAGGVTIATKALAEELTERGHVVSIHSHDDVPTWLPARLVLLANPFVLAHRIATMNPLDIVCANPSDAWWWMRRRQSRTPAFVVRSHGLPHAYYEVRRDEWRRGHQQLTRRYRLYHGTVVLAQVAASLRSADAVMFLNQEERKWAVERLGVQDTKATVIPNGLSDEFIARAARERPHTAPQLVVIGSYNDIKGVRYLIAPFEELLRTRTDLHVVFLGTGGATERIRRDYDPSLHDRIAIIERFEHTSLPDLIHEGSIVVWPALAEGFGLGLLEAMACGLVPVVSDAFGPSDIVRHGVDGLRVPPRDSLALRVAVEQLLDQSDLREALSASARARAATFTWRRTADEFETIFARIAERR